MKTNKEVLSSILFDEVLESLRTKYNLACNDVCHYETENRRYKKENKKLRECVEFYADYNNYIDEESCGYPMLIHKEQLNSGMKARQTLKELEGEK